MGHEMSKGSTESALPGCIVAVHAPMAVHDSICASPVSCSSSSVLAASAATPSPPTFVGLGGDAACKVEALKNAAAASAAPKKKKGSPVKRTRRDEEEEDQEFAIEDMGPQAALAKKQKPPADPQGYRFRKYGKKMIGETARHYYRCTHPGCEAKRHVTYEDGEARISSLGVHCHDPPVAKPRKTRASICVDKPLMSSSLVLPPQTLQRPPEEFATPQLVRMSDPFPLTENVFADGASFVAAVEQFDQQSDKDEVSFSLHGRVSHNEDGHFWLQLDGSEFQETFRCTVLDCPAMKHVHVGGGSFGLTRVTYMGLHNHSRPIVSFRSDEPWATDLSPSGSSGDFDVFSMFRSEGVHHLEDFV